MTEMSYQETILIDAEYLKSLLIDINQAQSSIDLEAYIYDDTKIKYQITDALCNAAQRGVTVRILVDGIGSLNWGGVILKKMETAGIVTKIFHPLPWMVWHWHRAAHVPDILTTKMIYLLAKINTRNHRKVCIIDKKIVYVGSANISEHLVDEPPGNLWRDTTVKLTNVNIEEIQIAFDRAWHKLPLKKRFIGYFKQKINVSIFRLNYSWRRKRLLYRALISTLGSGQKIIFVSNSYFVPRWHLMKKLISASRRGVNICVLLPFKTDVYIAGVASEMYFKMLLENGIKVYLYLPTMMHAKILIVDDFYLVGTSNLNHRSFRHDLEVDVRINSSESKNILLTQFYHDLKQAKQLTIDDLKKQTWYKKVMGYLLLLVRNWL